MVGWWMAAAWAAPCASVVDGRLEGTEVLTFPSGKAELADAAAVDPLACALRDHPELAVQVAVHSDSQGADVFNLRLTQARADAVRAALIARGVPGDHVAAVGFGETRPLGPNDTAEGRARNRRVELWVDPSRWATPPEAPPAPAPALDPVDPCRPVDGCVKHACRVDLDPATAASLVARCFGGSPLRDGAVWYVNTPAGAVRVAPADRGAELSPAR